MKQDADAAHSPKPQYSFNEACLINRRTSTFTGLCDLIVWSNCWSAAETHFLNELVFVD